MTETILLLQNFFLQNNDGSEHSDNEFQYPDSIIWISHKTHSVDDSWEANSLIKSSTCKWTRFSSNIVMFIVLFRPERNEMQAGHDEIIALLNQKMADKAR